jgi:hypothetical protein
MLDTKAPIELTCHLPADSRIVVVGLGGIGSMVLRYLSVFLNNLRVPLRLVLVDGDDFQPRDAARQTFATLGNKAEVKAAETLALLGDGDVTIAAVPEYVTTDNLSRLVRPGDHVFLCVDNHPTRKMVSDHCQSLADVALFSGGNDGVDPPAERGTYGNVQIAIRRDARDLTAPLTRFHPEIASPKGKHPGDIPCGKLAESVPQILFTNLAVASAMLSAFFAYTCGQLTYQEVKLDILDARMLPQFPVAVIGPADMRPA